MKLPHVRAGLISLALVGASLANGQTLESELMARSKGFEHALQTKDSKFLETYFSPTFVAYLPNGQTADREATLKAFGDLMAKAETIHWTWKMSPAGLSSRGALMDTQSSLVVTAIGPDKKRHRLQIDGVNQDTWILVGTQWELDSLKMLKAAATLDGKPVPAPGVAP